ncbi:MAG: hypothetical protein ABFS32_20310 [Bacteroidota bacterium]
MRSVKLILATMLLGLIGATTLTSCTVDGCTDPAANNYDVEAEKDDGSCTYPVITFNTTGNDGDVIGEGGSATSTFDWTNSLARAELNMDITAATGGSFQVIIEDADGVEVLNETLTVGIGDDSKNVCSTSGTAGTWTVTVYLTNFNGDGSYSLSQGC